MAIKGQGIVDMVGKHFGKLTVISYADTTRNGARWKCRCECGSVVVRIGCNLRSSGASDCGCGNDARAAAAREFHNSHGLTNHPASKRWWGMWDRCTNPNHISYKNYGGRGIRVCRKWKSLKAFVDWADSNGFRPDLSLDRIKVNENYKPSNCRWIPKGKQQRNKTNNLWIEVDGVSKLAIEWQEITGIDQGLIKQRIRYGWNPKDAVTKPPQRRSIPASAC